MDTVHDKIVDRLTKLEKAIDHHSFNIVEFDIGINNQLFILNERLERLTYSIEDLSKAYHDWRKLNKRK